jgi:hypothetical protein
VSSSKASSEWSVRRLSGDALQSGQVGFGSISAGRVVDLDGRKQSASQSGAESDLHARRDRPGPGIHGRLPPGDSLYLVRREAHYRVPDSAIPIDDPLFAEYLRGLSIETLT